MTHRIVVCDDEVHIGRAVAMKLTRAGFGVEVCPDGRAGLEAIQREKPVLLISDLQMPRMGGLELCRLLRADAATSNLPVILLTAKGYELDHDELKQELWLSHIILKPFSPRELLQAVLETLGMTEAPVAAG